MLSIEQIVDWRGQDVFDRDGERLGKLDEVYYDRDSGEARLASVKGGLLGRRGMLVPLDGASAGRDYLRVAFSAEQVKGTGGVDSDETLSPDALARVRDAYGVDLAGGVALEAATLLERRRGEAAAATEEADDLERTALEAADAAKDARAHAEEATRTADDAERAAVDAQAAAAAAREAAAVARRNAGMTASDEA